MIDDSVPTSGFKHIKWAPLKQNEPIGFEDVLKTVESMTAVESMTSAALIGLTSTFSIENLKETSKRHLINECTPTSCIFVCLMEVPDTVNYDCQLYSKEDVIFAARIIDAGKNVVINRLSY